MSQETKAPPRLRESSEHALLRRMLDAGANHRPSDDTMARMAARLGTIGGGGGGAGGGGSVATAKGTAAKGLATKGTAALLAKGIGGLFLGAAISTTAVHVWKGAAKIPPESTGAAAGATSSLPVLQAPSSTASEAAIPMATDVDVMAAAPTARTKPVVAPSAAPSAGDSADAELLLLKHAQESLRTDPAAALAFAGEHRSRFPRGMFAQEREVIAVEALTKLGRASGGRSAGAGLRPRLPNVVAYSALVDARWALALIY